MILFICQHCTVVKILSLHNGPEVGPVDNKKKWVWLDQLAVIHTEQHREQALTLDHCQKVMTNLKFYSCHRNKNTGRVFQLSRLLKSEIRLAERMAAVSAKEQNTGI